MCVLFGCYYVVEMYTEVDVIIIIIVLNSAMHACIYVTLHGFQVDCHKKRRESTHVLLL